MKEKTENKKLNADNDDMCDLDSTKICDDCMECLGLNDSDYKVVQIDGLIDDLSDVEDYNMQNENIISDTYHELNDSFEVEYIEDLPDLKEEYDKKIDKLLGRE
jgi:hypothetical protein